MARLTASKLQCDRMLLGIEREQALAVAVQNRGGRDHLRIEKNVGREATEEEPTVAVGPVHHGGDGDCSV